MGDRRIGNRIDTEGLQVAWRVDPRPPSRRRKAKEPEFAEVVNLSTSGAGIVAPCSEELRVGAHVLVESAGSRGLVKIRQIRDFDDPGRHYYGVEFVEVSPDLMSELFRQLADERPPDIEDIWKRAT